MAAPEPDIIPPEVPDSDWYLDEGPASYGPESYWPDSDPYPDSTEYIPESF